MTNPIVVKIKWIDDTKININKLNSSKLSSYPFIFVSELFAKSYGLFNYDIIVFNFNRNFVCQCWIIPNSGLLKHKEFDKVFSLKTDIFTNGNNSDRLENDHEKNKLISNFKDDNSNPKNVDCVNESILCGQCFIKQNRIAEYNVGMSNDYFQNIEPFGRISDNLSEGVTVQLRKIIPSLNNVMNTICLTITNINSTDMNVKFSHCESSLYQLSEKKRKWDIYDLLHESTSAIILKKSLEDSVIDAESQLHLVILGTSVSFKIVSIGNDAIESVFESCYGCNLRMFKCVYLSSNIKVNILPPIDSSIKLKLTHEKRNDIGINKLGGRSHIISSLCNTMILPLVLPSSLSDLDIPLPKGILVHGPSGTGKTFTIQCILEELEKNWLSILEEYKLFIEDSSIVFPPFVEVIYSNDLPKEKYQDIVKDTFEKCFKRMESNKCGCVLFIDDIDILCRSDVNYDHSSNHNDISNLLIYNIDKITTSQRFIVIATTTQLEYIPSKLRRSGRFDREIEIDVPNGDERALMLEKILVNKKHCISSNDLNEIAWECSAFVASDLVSLCNKASELLWEDIVQDLSQNISSKPELIGDRNQIIQTHHMRRALIFIKPSAMKEVAVEIPSVKWDDIGGYNHVKSILQQCVEWPIKYHDIFKKFDAVAPKGILMYGPPGCSKTLLAKAVATESKMNFIAVKGPELFSKWVGDSEKAVRDVFRKARQNSPCVIFFDEIDAIGSDRETSSSSSGVENRVLSQMLNEMDGIQSTKQVIVIGATNRPNFLDAALLRPGRLDRLVYVPLPDTTTRESIFLVHLKSVIVKELKEKEFNNVYSVPQEHYISVNLLPLLSQCTEGYTGAEIAMICRESIMLALKEHIERIENKINQESINHDSIQVQWRHLQHCLSQFKPRISKKLISFYDNYNKSHENTF